MNDDATDPVDGLLFGGEVTWPVRKRFRDDLRAARVAVQGDAEGFEVVVHAIERLGRHLHPAGRSLNDYEPHIIRLVAAAGAPVVDLDAQLFLLRQVRNDHAHQGSFARNASREAVRVGLRLEDALSVGWADIRVEHVMVAGAVTAQPGDTLEDVRVRMLAHAYTAIPARIHSRWYLLTDRWLAVHLLGKGRTARDEVLGTPVAVAAGELMPEWAVVVPRTLLLRELGTGALQRSLVLVANEETAERLDGVLAPADLL